MNIIIRNYLFSLCIIILLLCIVYLPFGPKSSSLDISYPADGYFQKGLASLSKDSLDNAATAFLNAIDYQPRFAPYHYYLAMTYEHKGEYKKAIKTYNRVVEIDPEFYPAFFHLGEILGEMKEYEQAIAMLRRAVQLNPYYIKAFKSLAKIYIQTGDQANAEKIFNYLEYIGYED